MQWLNQNSGAVQAIMAVIIGFLTVVLIGVTWWYARLTRGIMERQLAAFFQPAIDLRLIKRFKGSGTERGVQNESISGTIVVSNKGELPIKIVAIAMKIVFENTAFPDQSNTWDAQQRVVASGKPTEFPHLTLAVPLGSIAQKHEQIAQSTARI